LVPYAIAPSAPETTRLTQRLGYASISKSRADLNKLLEFMWLAHIGAKLSPLM
jgi:hypothetical protein